MRISAIFLTVLFFTSSLFAAERPELVLQTGHTGGIQALAISPDGKWLVSGGQDSTLKIWSLEKGNLLRTLYGHNSKISGVAISPDARYIASAADDGTTRLWELAGGQAIRELSGHRNIISSVAFISGGQQLLTGSSDVIKVWEAATGQVVRSIPIPEKDQEGRLTLSADGRTYTTGGAITQPGVGFLGFGGGGSPFRPLKVFEISNGRELMSYKTDSQSPYASFALSPDSRFLAVRAIKIKDATVNESVRVFDVQSDREVATLRIPGQGSAHGIGPMAFSANGNLLAVQGQFSETLKMPVYLFDVSSKQLLRELKPGGFFFPGADLDVQNYLSNPFAFSKDGTILALGGSNSVQLWDPNTGKDLWALKTHLKAGATTDAAMDEQWKESMKAQGVSLDDATMMSEEMSGGMMESMMDSEGPLGQIIESTTGLTGLGATQRAYSDKRLQFSPDGKWLVSEVTNQIRIWDLSVGSFLQPRFAMMQPIAFSHDGFSYASMERDVAEMMKGGKPALFFVVRKLETMSEIVRTKWGDAEPEELVFGPDNSWIAAKIGQDIRILDVKTGNVQRTIPLGNYSAEVNVFSSTGRYFAMGGKPFAPADSSSPFGSMMSLDPKMLEQMTKAMGNQKMDKKQMEKMQKEMAKVLGSGQMANLTTPNPSTAMDTSNYNIQIFDLQGGQKIQTLGIENPIQQGSKDGVTMMPFGGGVANYHRMIFSKDGNFLAVEDLDQQYPSVKIYETGTGRRVASIRTSNKRYDAPDKATDMFTQKIVRPSFVFHPNSSLIAINSQESGYSVNLFEIQSGKQVRSLVHNNRVDTLAFSPDGRILATRIRDGSLNLWEISGGALLGTLLEFPGMYFTTEWLVATSDGLFDGSPAAWSQIMWRFSENVFDLAPVETFFNEYYYPGLLTEILSSTPPRAPRDLSKLDRRQPVVSLQSDAKGDARNITIRIDVKEAAVDSNNARGSGAQDVRLFRNGTLVKVWRGDVLKDQQERILQTTVPLMSGDNRFVAYAFNRDNVKSADSFLKITGAENLKRKGIAYIVAIGINQYAASDFNLKFAVADAEAFSQNFQLAQTQLGKFEKVQVISLYDQQATKANILSTLNAFAEAGNAEKNIRPAEPEDALFIYYAGHGTAEKSHFYMVPHDLGYQGSRAQMSDADFQTILKHAISDEELEQVLERVPAGQTLFVIDACNSGQALESREKRRGPMNAKGLAQLAYEKGIYILAAAQGYQAALEANRLGHGYLTYALVVEGMKNKSADFLPQDGTVVVREWLNYASRRVPEMQSEKMQEARLLKHEIAFVEGEEKIQDLKLRSVQQPRVFYRREMETNPLIIQKQ